MGKLQAAYSAVSKNSKVKCFAKNMSQITMKTILEFRKLDKFTSSMANSLESFKYGARDD